MGNRKTEPSRALASLSGTWVGLLLAGILATGAACQRSAKAPETADDSAGSEPADAEEATSADEVSDEDAPPEDPERAELEELAATGALAPKSDAPASSAPLGLRLEIVERGAGLPWTLAIVNDGPSPVRVVGDPRLLSLELLPPASDDKKAKAPKPVSCKLPGELFPEAADPELVRRLRPGEALLHAFDPRLYCFDEDARERLAPGTVVTPSFGWPEKKPKTVWRKGKRVEEPVEQEPPFVARAHGPGRPGSDGDAEKDQDAPADDAATGPSDDAATSPSDDDAPAAEQVKRLTGRAFTLGSSYGATPTPERPPEPLALEVRGGSDTSHVRYATIEVRLKNTSREPQRVFFRRELVTFEVMGPDGLFVCDPQPDDFAPDPQGFQRLSPGGSTSAVSRLIELCPDGTFDRPGLYRVHARYDASVSGAEHGLDTFTGRVFSERPAMVRIREGEGGVYFEKRPMVRVRVTPAKPDHDQG